MVEATPRTKRDEDRKSVERDDWSGALGKRKGSETVNRGGEVKTLSRHQITQRITRKLDMGKSFWNTTKRHGKVVSHFF
jgi:hypothetical protein